MIMMDDGCGCGIPDRDRIIPSLNKTLKKVIKKSLRDCSLGSCRVAIGFTIVWYIFATLLCTLSITVAPFSIAQHLSCQDDGFDAKGPVLILLRL